MKKISIIFLLLLQIFQILSIQPNDTDIINLNGSYSKKHENVEEKYFQINITSANIPNFLKIQVTNTESTKNPSYIMTFVKSLDPSAEREQISKGEKSSLMWLTKNQLDKENNLLYVTCYNPPCNYNLNLESSNELNMDFDTQFNLYVTDNNKEIEINFSSEKDGFKASFITLWGIGNKNPEVTLLEGYDYIRSKNYNTFKIKTDSMNKSSYIMKIKAEVGDVINIGQNYVLVLSLFNALEKLSVAYNFDRIPEPEKEQDPPKDSNPTMANIIGGTQNNSVEGHSTNIKQDIQEDASVDFYKPTKQQGQDHYNNKTIIIFFLFYNFNNNSGSSLGF